MMYHLSNQQRPCLPRALSFCPVKVDEGPYQKTRHSAHGIAVQPCLTFIRLNNLMWGSHFCFLVSSVAEVQLIQWLLRLHGKLQILIRWLHQKPSDLALHSFLRSIHLVPAGLYLKNDYPYTICSIFRVVPLSYSSPIVWNTNHNF